jgi:hypothetical protein
MTKSVTGKPFSFDEWREDQMFIFPAGLLPWNVSGMVQVHAMVLGLKLWEK